MAGCQYALVVYLCWSNLCTSCFLTLGVTRAERHFRFLQETVEEHMHKLYDKYTRTGFHYRDGNTVRSFPASVGTIKNREMQFFNLTSLTESEDVVSATLHIFVGDLQNSTGRSVRHKDPRHPGESRVRLGLQSFPSVDGVAQTLGYVHVKVPVHRINTASWQWEDITHAIRQAKLHSQLLVGVEGPTEGLRKDLLFGRSPYILVYANDSAISCPESAVATLPSPTPHLLNHTTRERLRRSVDVLLPLQNNELPGHAYPHEVQRWEETDTNDPPDNRPVRRHRKKVRKSQRHKLLRFDGLTLKKAYKKQWNEPLKCARRYLRVDFADIGWSDWIISPKSFDAYYCSGSCQFPMAKSLKPSNHATIQSIVRAVGVVPGVPEPCCVPEKMSPLSILFFDHDKNVVLKVYPNMTVDSCVCR